MAQVSSEVGAFGHGLNQFQLVVTQLFVHTNLAGTDLTALVCESLQGDGI